MAVQVSITQAEAGFMTLVVRAEAGEEVIVMRDGRPVARLGPVEAAGPVLYGDVRGLHVADDPSIPDDVAEAFAAPGQPWRRTAASSSTRTPCCGCVRRPRS